jgi:molybdopterin molybdotransferase
MLNFEDALKAILDSAPELAVEKVPALYAESRILAQDVKAREGFPPFDNSSRDGFALSANAVKNATRQHPVKLTVLDVIKAGSPAPQRAAGPGECYKIMTGAPIPPGADAVVMREYADELEGAAAIWRPAETGENIRRQNADTNPGDIILKRGAKVRSFETALLAGQGIEEISVFKKPRVAVIPTGDELAAANDGWHIRDSNGPGLCAALESMGAAPLRFAPVADTLKAQKEAFAFAADSADIVLISGGVSVGDFDFTGAALNELGFKRIFWKVALKPGKPLLFGTLPARGKNIPVFGLPGNPLSTLVGAELFVRPLIERMCAAQPAFPWLEGKVSNGCELEPGRRNFLFCRAAWKDGFEIEILRGQDSNMLSSACKANALAMAQDGATALSSGDKITFRFLA